MNTQRPIEMSYDPKARRIVAVSPFYYVDYMRAFPSRRFDPKTKAWKMPLTRQNVEYWRETTARYKLPVVEHPSFTAAVADLERLTRPPVYVPYPSEFFELVKYTPYDHQAMMLNRAWGMSAHAFFAAMGTGKTYVSVLLAIARWRAGLIDKLVIICPEGLRVNWRKEFDKYLRNPNEIDFRLHSSNDHHLQAWAAEPSKQLKVLMVSVEGLGISAKLYDHLCGAFVHGKTMTIVDESTRIKNEAAIRTQRAIDIGAVSAYRMILNGTPIAKGIQDLWSQYEFLDPHIIGSGDYWAYRTRYLMMGGYENKEVIGFTNVDELMRLITPYSTEVDKSVLKLPPKVFKPISLMPSKKQLELFERIRKSAKEQKYEDLDNVVDVPADPEWIKVQNVLERALRAQQVCGGFEPRTDRQTLETTVIPLADNPKMDALIDLVENNRIGTKFIIWARFVHEIEAIEAKLTALYGPSVVSYYGKTSKEDRSIAVDRYNTDESVKFFVGNQQAAGIGLTLISGMNDVMVYYSNTYSYVDRAQSEDRSHRIGQHRTVTIVDLTLEGTVDEAIAAALSAKLDLDQYIKESIRKGHDIQF